MANMKQYKIPEIHCPYCNTMLDAAGSIAGEDGAPKAKDITVCVQCFQVSIYSDDGCGILTLKKITADELEAFKAECPIGYKELQKAIITLKNIVAHLQ